MPHFAPNKYVINQDKNGRDYQEFSNVPDMNRVIEVTESQAEQVMRKQPQWIEVKPHEVKPEPKPEAIAPVVEKTTLEKVEEAFKQRGRPKVKK